MHALRGWLIHSCRRSLHCQRCQLYTAASQRTQTVTLSRQHAIRLTGDIVSSVSRPLPWTAVERYRETAVASNIAPKLVPATRAARGTASPSTSTAGTTVAVDPNSGYATDDDGTRASLLAFAEFEAKQRTRATVQHAAKQSSPTPPSIDPDSAAIDNETTSASMDAFAAMERELTKKKVAAKYQYLTDPTATATVATPQSANTSNSGSVVLVPPRQPEAWECCGMSCPNCVWIQYAEQMAQYEEAKQRFGAVPVQSITQV